MDADRIQRLTRSLELALNQEWPQLDRTCRKVSGLRPVRIDPEAASSRGVVATVATDGGESRLRLEPIRIQVIRVADSLGVIHFEQFIPQSLRPEEIIRFFFAGEERLRRMLDYLALEWDELIPKSDYQKSNLLGMLRELLEWAATIKLAAERKDLLILRDGLLRSVLLSDGVFAAIRRRLEDLTRRNGHLLAGVAKRSAVINYLSIGLGLTSVLAGPDPAYLRVGADLEREASPSQYRWMSQRGMGVLFVARLDRGEAVPLMPVDIAAWQENEAAQAMTLLHRSARLSFPLRGYPQELTTAHRHAHLGEFETQVLESLLMQEVVARSPTLGERVRQLRMLGRRLVEEESDESAGQ